MIISKKPLTLGEVAALVPKAEEKRPIDDYLKNFAALSKEDSLKLMEEVRALNNPKLKEENIVKIADFLPKDMEDINKILTEAGLSEAEANAILEITKKY